MLFFLIIPFVYFNFLFNFLIKKLNWFDSSLPKPFIGYRHEPNLNFILTPFVVINFITLTLSLNY